LFVCFAHRLCVLAASPTVVMLAASPAFKTPSHCASVLLCRAGSKQTHASPATSAHNACHLSSFFAKISRRAVIGETLLPIKTPPSFASPPPCHRIPALQQSHRNWPDA
jgi:hypothetical protein